MAGLPLTPAIIAARDVLVAARIPVCAIKLPDKAGTILSQALTVFLILCAVVAAFPHFLRFNLVGTLVALVAGSGIAGVVGFVLAWLSRQLEAFDSGDAATTKLSRAIRSMLPTPEARGLLLKWLYLFVAVSLLSAGLFILESIGTELLGGSDPPTYSFLSEQCQLEFGPMDCGRVLQFAVYAGLVLIGFAATGRYQRLVPGGNRPCSAILSALVILLLVALFGGLLTSVGRHLFASLVTN